MIFEEREIHIHKMLKAIDSGRTGRTIKPAEIETIKQQVSGVTAIDDLSDCMDALWAHYVKNTFHGGRNPFSTSKELASYIRKGLNHPELGSSVIKVGNREFIVGHGS